MEMHLTHNKVRIRIKIKKITKINYCMMQQINMFIYKISKINWNNFQCRSKSLTNFHNMKFILIKI